MKTSNATYYIAISAGKFEHKAEAVYCISASTPIGKLLLGKTKEMSFVFQGKNHEILEVQ